MCLLHYVIIVQYCVYSLYCAQITNHQVSSSSEISAESLEVRFSESEWFQLTKVLLATGTRRTLELAVGIAGSSLVSGEQEAPHQLQAGHL